MNHAEKQAFKLLAELNIDNPPVPVEVIAKNMGAALVFEPFGGKEDISGILYRDNEHTIIGINSAHPKTRQRFSIAHEIGHLILHNNKKKMFVDKVVRVDFRDSRSSLAIDQEEMDANAFASELLMPRDFIINEINRSLTKRQMSISKEKLIKQLSKTFQASQQAMEYRLNNLGILVSQ